MTANVRTRTVILAAAFLGHVGLVVLLLSEIDVLRRQPPPREPEPLLAMLLDSLVRPQPPPALPPPQVRLLPLPSEAITIPLPELDAQSAGGSAAPPVSDSVPRVDWMAEREREVALVMEREAASAARRRIGQHPKGMDLPHDSLEPSAGTVEHHTGGETIEWINSRCYFSSKRSIPRIIGFGLAICKQRPSEDIKLSGPRDGDE